MTIPPFFKNERYFVIKQNNKIEEYSALEKALVSKEINIVVIDRFKGTCNPPYGYSWRISTFDFRDENNKSIRLSYNSWTIQNIETQYKSSSTIQFILTIEDPCNLIRHKKYKLDGYRSYDDINIHDMNIVIFALKILKEHSLFSNWTQKDLMDENRCLKKQVEQLHAELKTLIKG